MGGNLPQPGSRATPPLAVTPAPPTPPFAAEPVPAIPVVEYRTAGARSKEGARPGTLTALGIVSICVGLLGLAVHLASMPAVGHMFDVTTPPAAPRMPPPLPPPPAVKPYAGEWRVDTGLGRADREVVVEYLSNRLSLGVDRRATLRKLLGDAGREIFPTAQSPLAEPSLTNFVTDAGQIPAGPDGLRTLGTHYFRTAAGSVLLDDHVGRFYPGDRRPPLRAEEGAFFRPGQPPRLAAVAIEEEVEDFRRQFGPRFNATQAAVLAARLAAPTYHPAFAAAVGRRIRASQPRVRMLSGDTVEYDDAATGTRIWIMSNGRLIQDPPPNLDPRTGQPPPPPPPAVRKRAMTRTLAVIGAIDLVVGVALATFLAVCGIMTLANAPSGGRNHARWAWLKLIAIAVFLAPSFATASAYAQDEKGEGAIGFIAAVILVTAAGIVIQLGYPIIVLAVMRSRAAGLYYAGLGESVEPVSAVTRIGWRRWAASFTATGRGRAMTTAALALLIVTMLAYTATTWSIESDERWYASTVARGVLLILDATAVVVCCVALKRRPAVAAVVMLLLATGAAHAAAPEAKQPAARKATGAMTVRLSPDQLGQLTEDAIVGKAAAARERLEAAALAADAPVLEALRQRPLPSDFRERVSRALRELGWTGCAETLRELLTDKDPAVRRQAAMAIKEYSSRLAPSWRELINTPSAGEKPVDLEARLLQSDRDRYATPVDWTARPNPADGKSTAFGRTADAAEKSRSPYADLIAPVAAWVMVALSVAVLAIALVYATNRRVTGSELAVAEVSA